MRYFLLASLLALTSCLESPAPVSPVPGSFTKVWKVPEMVRWQNDMATYGEKHCSRFSDPKISDEMKLAGVYYDQSKIFFNIADYTHNYSYWNNCARKASAVYRRYVKDSKGAVPGYWVFSEGLIEEWVRFKDAESLAALKLLLANGSFVNSSGWVDNNQPSEMYIRETAYALELHINSIRFGVPHNRTRIDRLKNLLLGHLDQQYIKRSAPSRKPFMAGLAAHALIRYYSEIQTDPKIVSTLIKVADYMRTKMWKGTGFAYTDSQAEGTEAAPDLNQLISPLYLWLDRQTSLPRFKPFADEIFRQGVFNSYMTAPKIYNQNYKFSFEYVKSAK